MQSTNAPLTSSDLDKIEMLILLGYTMKQATEAYLLCDRDVTKASDFLATNKHFNKKVQAHLSTIMDDKLGPEAFLGLGEDFELVQDIHEYFDYERQLEFIKKVDAPDVNQLTEQGQTKGAAIQTHLNYLKWQPNM